MESFQDLVQSPTLVSVELPVLGLPVCFETNDEQLLEVVEEAFGAWRIMEGMPGLLSSRRFRVRFVVREGDEGPEPHASLAYEVPVPHFRYGVLEALTLALLTCFDRMPFHAAAIVRGGSALLLAGPTGVGKSTLAYAALRAGFRVLTDDAVYLQMDPALGIWGVPGHLHLPVDAPRHFPELAGATLTLRANGKKKISVDVRAMGGMVERPMIEDAALCLLRRGDGPPAVRAASASEIEATLAARVEPGFDLFADAIGPAVARLAERGGWMLRVGGEPTGVMEVVRSVFDDFQRA
jgi:hypothetical protein